MSFAQQGVAILGTANATSFAGLKAGDINQFILGNPAGRLVGELGLKLAALGGQLQKGIFVWDNPTNAPSLQKFVFQMNPSELRDSVSPEYAKHLVPGQNRPIYHFINGGEREVSFTLNFFYDDRRREAIRDQLAQLRGLTQRPLGVPGSGADQGPPAVFFYFGKYITAPNNRFLVTRVNIRAFDLFDPLFLLPLRAEAELTLVEAVDPNTYTRTETPERGDRQAPLSTLISTAF